MYDNVAKILVRVVKFFETEEAHCKYKSQELRMKNYHCKKS